MGAELRALVGGGEAVLCGVSTECCVLMTALAAVDDGAHVRVVADACAAKGPKTHERCAGPHGHSRPPAPHHARSAEELRAMMHLGMILLGAGGHVAGWRMPDAEFGLRKFPAPETIAATAERGKFDFVFLADALNTGLDAHPGMMVRLEPLTLLAALSQHTTHIGLGATVSTTYSEPYNVARMLASIDHLSGGRPAGTSSPGRAPTRPRISAATSTRRTPNATRWRPNSWTWSKGLWDSWEDGAIIGDKATGRFADPAKLHVLDHRGRHYQVKGPLNITRPPQGHPVILQAGASDAGPRLRRRRPRRSCSLRNRTWTKRSPSRPTCAPAASRPGASGRHPHPPRRQPRDRPTPRPRPKPRSPNSRALTDPVASLKVLSDRLGHDLGRFDLDAPVPDLPPSGMMQGHAIQLHPSPAAAA